MREKAPLLFDLQSMLLVEENHAGVSMSTHANNKMFYMEEDRLHGHGGRGGSTRNEGGRHEQNQRHGGVATIVPNPREVRGVKVAPETGKESPQ